MLACNRPAFQSNEATERICMASGVGSFLLRLALAFVIVFLVATSSHAGGPKHVAGTSYFDSSVAGQPLLWPGGIITYYTDQGDLSPVLPNASANLLVADSFSQWTAVPTAALNISSGGQLAEDVNGTNVTVNSDGSISMPADILPSATGTPVGIVYDLDGSVTDALLGAGAGDSGQCFFNAVFGGDDNFDTSASYQHALIVINGQCAQQSSQTIEIEYRLVRTIGNVLGLGWSQVNINVLTGNPPPTDDDYLGFPVMHDSDPVNCVPITTCYSNPYQLAVDDAAALSRIYPVTVQNQSSFPGSQIFASSTAAVHGSVWFTDTARNPTQPMQGVNVVARWIDPSTGLPSRRYVLSSVSGFLFTGNAGNPITGFNDALGTPYTQWGSSNPNVEGSFDLSGLPLPNGGSAQYQITVEPVDPGWSVGVGPYAPYQVTPSGLFQPVVVTVTAGQNIEQDIFMSGSAQPVPPWASSQSWTAPAPITAAGDWMGSLSGYGNFPYFQFTAQANRTLSVTVTALDELGNPTEGKVQPVIGIWAASDPQGTAPAAFTSSPFNTLDSGTTQLDAQIEAASSLLLGIADLRGDGRPDYRYHASVLYADAVSPPRVSVNGGAVTVTGIGFSAAITAALANLPAAIEEGGAGDVILALPPQRDGPQSLAITDPANGASSVMTNALIYGAAASDSIILLSGLNPSTAVGTQATNPVTVRVVQADGLTPVGGATVAWSATNGLQLSACAGAASCSVLTDESGYAATWLIPAASGVSTITAALAPETYLLAKSVQATLSATESSSDLGVELAYLWIAQGATLSAPLIARVLSNGVPQSNATVNFSVASGSAALSGASAQTDSSGYATVTLSVAQFASEVQINACLAPSDAPCRQIYVTPIPLANLNLQPVAGAGQISTQGLSPVIVRVVDSASPPHAVLGAAVQFQTTVLRPEGTPGAGGNGETNPTNPAMPIILSVTQATVASDVNGLANITPSSGGFSAPVEVDVGVTAGTTAALDFPLELLPGANGGNSVWEKKLPPQRPSGLLPRVNPQGLAPSGRSSAYWRASDNCR